MPYDVTMCPGGDCPLRLRCYRYRAVPVARQDALTRPPYDAARDVCESFWDIAGLEPREDDVRVRAWFLWERAGRPDDPASAERFWYAARAELDAHLRALLRDDVT